MSMQRLSRLSRQSQDYNLDLTNYPSLCPPQYQFQAAFVCHSSSPFLVRIDLHLQQNCSSSSSTWYHLLILLCFCLLSVSPCGFKLHEVRCLGMFSLLVFRTVSHTEQAHNTNMWFSVINCSRTCNCRACLQYADGTYFGPCLMARHVCPTITRPVVGEQKGDVECSEAVSSGALMGCFFKVISLACQLLLFAGLSPRFPEPLLL